MHLLSLRIENFKNYEKAGLEFSPALNCLTGNNGAGKTNILDAVYYLCSGKSYFNSADQQLIRDNEDFFSLRGEFKNGDRTDQVACVLVRGRKKVIKRNDEAYLRLIDHYGIFPAIFVAPADIELVMGHSEERRRWLDSAISLNDRDYLLALLQYNQLLLQRNAELKNMAIRQAADRHLLEVYDKLLSPLAWQIYEKRKAFLADFLSRFNELHQELARQNEKVDIQYLSGLHEQSLQKLLDDSFRKDLLLQRTHCGIHRDELEFLLDGNSLKRFGSQGQQKTFLLALKMAQHQDIAARKGIQPLLLLDDVCERLDEQRLKILFGLLKKGSFGQVFVSDVSAERILHLLSGEEAANAAWFRVEKGRVVQEKGMPD